MALREKLAARAAPFLEPGEQVRHVFLAQTGPSPMFVLLTYFINFFSKFWVVVVTDRAVLVLKAGVMAPAKPKSLDRRVARVTIGPVSGLWGQTNALGDRMWIHKRFHKDVQAADAELAAGGGGYPPPPTQGFPPPPAS